jgi:hypothetical protein
MTPDSGARMAPRAQGTTTLARWQGQYLGAALERRTWTRVPSPNPGTEVTNTVSRTDAWAVGIYEVSRESKTLVLHWNDTCWACVAAPSPGRFASSLNAVSADSFSDAWAVGCECAGGRGHGVILHWEGTRWLRS